MSAAATTDTLRAVAPLQPEPGEPGGKTPFGGGSKLLVLWDQLGLGLGVVDVVVFLFVFFFDWGGGKGRGDPCIHMLLKAVGDRYASADTVTIYLDVYRMYA